MTLIRKIVELSFKWLPYAPDLDPIYLLADLKMFSYRFESNEEVITATEAHFALPKISCSTKKVSKC